MSSTIERLAELERVWMMQCPACRNRTLEREHCLRCNKTGVVVPANNDAIAHSAQGERK